ncbi:MAG: DEAD/DEAH box helicase [Planctomycetota bacterium]
MKVPWSTQNPSSTHEEPTEGSIAEVLARLRESVANRLSLEVRPVQVEAGLELTRQSIVEMETGEGKTLTTVIPACLFASSGKQVLVATANDYLAKRDAEWMRPVYDDLGVSVGYVTADGSDSQRSQAYRSAVTYGTLREFGFDFLRDCLAARQSLSSQSADPRTTGADATKAAPTEPTKLRFDVLIVDEADSVLIDEARTPLVITSPTHRLDEEMQACYRWCAEVANQFGPGQDFLRLADSGAVALTQQGRRRFMQLDMPPELRNLTTTDLLHSLERALWINANLHRDIDYLVKEGRVDLIDEYTGRTSTNRALGAGLHQAVEAREGLELTAPSEPIARISVQEFAMKFKHLCGLTATASGGASAIGCR